jgi:hypothetical protein
MFQFTKEKIENSKIANRLRRPVNLDSRFSSSLFSRSVFSWSPLETFNIVITTVIKSINALFDVKDCFIIR